MRVFAKRVPVFDPSLSQVLGFATEHCRKVFIDEAEPGDLVVCVGTAGASRGRLLGLAEVWLPPNDAENDRGGVGKSDVIAIRRAWAFEPQLLLFDLLQERLIFESDDRAVRLQEFDAGAVLAVPRIEIPLPDGPEYASENVRPELGPTTGPAPQPWTGVVSRDLEGAAWTYLMRFGSRDLWKVGYSQDVQGRLLQLNEHVPMEELGECWSVFLTRRWPSALEAYEMEQRVLVALTPFRSTGERVRCSEGTVLQEWERASVGREA